MATDYDFSGARVKARNPFAPFGLGLITFGFYIWYWWYAVNRELRDASKGRIDVSPGVALLAHTLGALIIVPVFVTFHKTGRRAQEMARLAGREELPSMWMYWLLFLFTGAGAYIYLQWELNKIWTKLAADGIAPGDAPHHAGLPDGEDRHHRGTTSGPFMS